MTQATADTFGARSTFKSPLGEKTVYRLDALRSLGAIDTLPYSIRVLLESCLRNHDGRIVTNQHLEALCTYDARKVGETEIPFTPGRVVLQDFTGVPAMVDLAAMRSAMVELGGDPSKVNPLVPCDLVIDHSVQVDAFASGVALSINSEKEFERNRERYEFLKWGQSAFDNFRVVPPATGIVHQVNLEYLARVVWESEGVLFPDSLVGTDSHTTMINGLGVVGWGVGGIEAEAVMLGQPIYMLIPEVVGCRLTGSLSEGTTATDLVLRVTELLRAHGVVGKFVEFTGPGLDHMPVANRATLANMAPEYGATIGYFPVDEHTLNYLQLTGRDDGLIETVEAYCRLQGLWRDENADRIVYADVLELDLATVEPALAGPKRPQDRVILSAAQQSWQTMLRDTFNKKGNTTSSVTNDGETFELADGAVVIAAITSCTNTSNPSVMVAAGLVARNAAARGLTARPWVKTSLAPGSKVVTEYLVTAGLLDDLETLGFHIVGYGCTTCIGNSGPLPEPISKGINDNDLVVCSVLSGNRNFEGRIHADIMANFLASPPLVVAYALVGTLDIDLPNDSLGKDRDGKDVYLRDIWPSESEIQETVARSISRTQFLEQYSNVFEGSSEWQAIDTSGGQIFGWPEESTYIQQPPFFMGISMDPEPIDSIRDARCLMKVADSVTTDHISPAGSIQTDSPAGSYLTGLGVPVSLFNSFGSRRGNDRLMTRGTFANVRVRNQLAPGTEGGFTTYLANGTATGANQAQVMSVFEASLKYREAGVPLVVLAGKDYGMGSSRDWAAKGTLLLGVKAVIARSFERIHRSNLVGMGVLPLTFDTGESTESLGLDGTEVYSIDIPVDLRARQSITVTARRTDGSSVAFTTVCRIDTPVEVEYYRNGGILHTVLRRMAKA